ncbi:TPA: hypothetical protein GXZ34_02635 [bacterium]|nr:hypothetical protein [bacterium]
MATTRMEKFQEIHKRLKEEEKNQSSKSIDYKKRLQALDPTFNDKKEEPLVTEKEKEVIVEKQPKQVEDKVVNKIDEGEKKDETDNNQLAEVVEKPVLKYQYSKEIFEGNEEISKNPASFTDKISVEELLRVRIEEQERLRANKKMTSRTPNTAEYTPQMMHERITPHEGVDIRKEVKLKKTSERNLVEKIILLILMMIIILGTLSLFYLILM